jgi:hypothetical protein
VGRAGREATANPDPAPAREHFTALKQSDEAIASLDSIAHGKVAGKAIGKLADSNLAKLKP